MVRRDLYNTVCMCPVEDESRPFVSDLVTGLLCQYLLTLHLIGLLGRVFADMQLMLAALLAPFVRNVESRWINKEPATSMRQRPS